MDGISLLNKVKEFSPDTIFIMITAFASFETAKKSMEKEAYDYITKPFDVEDRKRKIDAALEKKKHAAAKDGALDVVTMRQNAGRGAWCI